MLQSPYNHLQVQGLNCFRFMVVVVGGIFIQVSVLHCEIIIWQPALTGILYNQFNINHAHY